MCSTSCYVLCVNTNCALTSKINVGHLLLQEAGIGLVMSFQSLQSLLTSPYDVKVAVAYVKGDPLGQG